jgi:hypothetical protein
MMITEHYRRLAADYFTLGCYCRYSMMTARERKPKSGACLGDHWDMTRRVARSGAFLSAPLTVLSIQ